MRETLQKDFLREPASLACTILVLTEGIREMKRADIGRFYGELQTKFSDVLPEVDDTRNAHMLRTAIERIITADMTLANTEWFRARVGDAHMARLRVAKEHLAMMVRTQ